jgi:hypothetical protein
MKNIDPVEIDQVMHQQSKKVVRKSLYRVLSDKMTGIQNLGDLF